MISRTLQRLLRAAILMGWIKPSNPLQVWTLTTTPGASGADGSGAYYGSQPSLGNAWQLYSYQNDGVGNGGSAFANTTFAGGALAIGQTVSINFNMRATDPGKEGGSQPVKWFWRRDNIWNFWWRAQLTYPYTGNGYYYTDAGFALRAPEAWVINIKVTLTLHSRLQARTPTMP